MIRILYRWKIKPGEEESFRKAWIKTTYAIRTSTKGARGSVLLFKQEDRSELIAIASWDSYEDWVRSRNIPYTNLEGAVDMQAKSVHISTEVLEELENLLVI